MKSIEVLVVRYSPEDYDWHLSNYREGDPRVFRTRDESMDYIKQVLQECELYGELIDRVSEVHLRASGELLVGGVLMQRYYQEVS